MEHAAKHERTHRLDVQNTNLWRQDLPASVDALLSAFTCASSNVNDESDFLAKLQHIFDEFRAMIFQRRQDLLRDVNLFQESNALVVIQLIPIFPRSPFFGGAIPASSMSAPLHPPSLTSIIVMRIHKSTKGWVFSTNPNMVQTDRQNSRQHSRCSWSWKLQVATSTAITAASCRSFSFTIAPIAGNRRMQLVKRGFDQEACG